VIVYEASPYPAVADPLILRVELQKLAESGVPLLSTLVVPPRAKARRNRAVMERLALR